MSSCHRHYRNCFIMHILKLYAYSYKYIRLCLVAYVYNALVLMNMKFDTTHWVALACITHVYLPEASFYIY